MNASMGLADFVTPEGTGGRTTGFWTHSSTPGLGAASSIPATTTASETRWKPTVIFATSLLPDLLGHPECFPSRHELDGNFADDRLQPFGAVLHSPFFRHVVP